MEMSCRVGKVQGNGIRRSTVDLEGGREGRGERERGRQTETEVPTGEAHVVGSSIMANLTGIERDRVGTREAQAERLIDSG